jgi:hypothetical protein
MLGPLHSVVRPPSRETDGLYVGARSAATGSNGSSVGVFDAAGDPVPQDMQDRAGRADRARQAARDGPGEPAADGLGTRLQITRPRPGHDCMLSGCRPYVCKPMAKSTIRGIHSILSGAFGAAMRWEWTDRNPAGSATPPTPGRQTILATSPEAVAKVIAEARARSAALGLYLWLWWSPASAAVSCAACRSATSTSTAPWCI